MLEKALAAPSQYNGEAFSGRQGLVLLNLGKLMLFPLNKTDARRGRAGFLCDPEATRESARLTLDAARTQVVAAEIRHAFEIGRKVLVLTERTEHLDALSSALQGLSSPPLVLHGRMSRKQRAGLMATLEALPPTAPRVLLASGKLVGEGFDHPPLDTLVLAMPISWKGTLQQYAGRLHRVHADKAEVRIIDFVDTGHPALMRMWDKRQQGYKAMGYRLAEPPSDLASIGQMTFDA